VKQILRLLLVSITALVLFNPASAWSKETVMATLEGPGEYQLSGSTECGGKTTTSTIKPGERFIASECDEKDCGVDLKSGIKGTIPRDRIRLLPGEPLARLNFDGCLKEWRQLQSKRINSSADDVAAYSAKKYHGGLNYYKTLVQASEGDAKAFRQLSSLLMDGEAGDENEINKWILLHVAGDDTYARLLAAQSSEFREGYAAFLESPFVSNPKAYLKLHFPKTYAILCGK
jgi:hypothetical protein